MENIWYLLRRYLETHFQFFIFICFYFRIKFSKENDYNSIFLNIDSKFGTSIVSNNRTNKLKSSSSTSGLHNQSVLLYYVISINKVSPIMISGVKSPIKVNKTLLFLLTHVESSFHFLNLMKTDLPFLDFPLDLYLDIPMFSIAFLLSPE